MGEIFAFWGYFFGTLYVPRKRERFPVRLAGGSAPGESGYVIQAGCSPKPNCKRLCQAGVRIVQADVRSGAASIILFWRMPTMNRGKSIHLAILIAIAIACAARGPTGPTPLQLAGQTARKILIAPLNVASSLPVELEDSSQLVIDSLVSHLDAHGKSHQVLAFRIGRSAWVTAAEETIARGLPQDFETASGLFARELRKTIEFDALLIPTLYVQNAEISRDKARWDGAAQRIKQVGKLPRWVDQINFNIMIKAASLMVAVISADGKTLHTKRVGLELMQHVEYHKHRNSEFSIVVEDNIPALSNYARVRSGIARSLKPFLPIDPPKALPEASTNSDDIE